MSIISVNLTFTRGAVFAIPLLLLLYTTIQFKSINNKALLGVALALSSGCYLTYMHSDNFKHRINYTIYEFSNIAAGNINIQNQTIHVTNIYDTGKKREVQK